MDPWEVPQAQDKDLAGPPKKKWGVGGVVAVSAQSENSASYRRPPFRALI